MPTPMIKVLISAGGSGGHLFPMISVAQAISEKYGNVQIRFVGTKRRIEAKVLPQYGYKTHYINIRGFYRSGIRSTLLSLILLPLAILKSMLIIIRFRPHVVLGSGSFTSGPVLLAALILCRRTAIQEQNASPGLTNRFLGRFSDIAFLATEPKDKNIFKNYIVTGNPIRKSIHQLSETNVEISLSPIKIYLVGGSQGAHKLNQALIECLPKLEPYSDRISIHHQTGEKDFKEIREVYSKSSVEGTATEFIDDIELAYKDASLIISRSGSVVFEFLAAGKPSILIPIPWSSGDHQKSNAETLVSANAAKMIEERELTGNSLFAAIEQCILNPEKLIEMGKNARSLYTGNSADKIAEELSGFFPKISEN